MKSYAILFAVSVAAMSAHAQAATLINANLSSPTLVGVFGPGSYIVTGSGLIDLVGPVGSGFTMRPDGIPDSTVTAPGYGDFNPNGSFTADGNFGPGGAAIKIGALMGTYAAIPSGPADYFLIGYGTVINLASTKTLYAQVNDTFSPNNGGAYSVSVSVAVPEPASWALMIGGFAIAGATMRRRALAVSFA